MIKFINKSENEMAYQTKNSAGFDICANSATTIPPGGRALIKTGLFIEGPEDGEEGPYVPSVSIQLEIRPRSGLAYKNGVTVLNTPGTVDLDYKQEIGVILINHGQEDFEVKVGDRIAQGVITPSVKSRSFKILDFERDGGFGSTGVK